METQTPSVTPSAPQATPQLSTLAVLSLALSLLGCFCLFFFGSIPGIILGHKAMARIRASNGMETGEGMAMAGLLLGYIGAVTALLAVIMFFAFVIPWVGREKTKSRSMSSINNLRQIGIAFALYEADHDETPPPDLKSIEKYIGGRGNGRMFIDPGSGTTPGAWDEVDTWSDYQYVTNAVGDDPTRTVRAFSKPHCYPNGGHILYKDGHVAWLEKEAYDEATAPFLKKH